MKIIEGSLRSAPVILQHVPPAFAVPSVVRSRAAVGGDGGAAWVSSLPQIAEDLQRLWEIRIGEQLPGGTASVVARATGNGLDAVVKIAVPGTEFAREAAVLAAADGRGYVRVYAADLERRALLLEPLGERLDRSGLAPERVLLALCDMLAQAWTVAPGLPIEPFDKAADLHELVTRLWADLGAPGSEGVRDEALRCADRRAAASDADAFVVLHGDAAAANALRVPGERAGAEAGFVLVDPEPFLGDPAYDLGVALRDWCEELASGDPVPRLAGWCGLVAERTGTDPAAVWDWAFLERVSTGLFALSLGAEEMARPLLRTAEALCR
jgi:streptomycin 6-kinase